MRRKLLLHEQIDLREVVLFLFLFLFFAHVIVLEWFWNVKVQSDNACGEKKEKWFG